MSQEKNQFAVEVPDELLQQALEGVERRERDRDVPDAAEASSKEPIEEEIPIDDSDDGDFIDVAADIQNELAAEEEAASKDEEALDTATEQLSEATEQLSETTEQLTETQVKLQETQSQLKKANRKVLELQTRLSQMEDNMRRAEQRRQDLDKEKQQIHDKMLRLSADFDNLRKRTARERQEMKKYGHENAMRDVVAPLDNFERAMEALVDVPDSVKQGIEMVYKQIQDVLVRHGVERFVSKGEPFDYTRHEAISVVESDELEPNMVLEEYQAGYMFHERLLRASRVVVTKAPPKPAPEPTPEPEAADAAEGDNGVDSSSEQETNNAVSEDGGAVEVSASNAEATAEAADSGNSAEAAAGDSESAGEANAEAAPEGSISSEDHQAAADLASDLTVEFSDEVPESSETSSTAPASDSDKQSS